MTYPHLVACSLILSLASCISEPGRKSLAALKALCEAN